MNFLVVNVSVCRTDTDGCKLGPISLRVYMTSTKLYCHLDFFIPPADPADSADA